jgi:aspartate kinase
VSPTPRIDMICGRNDIVGIEIFDSEMVGQSGYDHRITEILAKHKISYIAKNTNANTITHYVSEKNASLKACLEELENAFKATARIQQRKVAIIGVIGSNMKIPGFLAKAAMALSDANINVLALDQCMRQVNMQFIIARENFAEAQKALHAELVEKQ